MKRWRARPETPILDPRYAILVSAAITTIERTRAKTTEAKVALSGVEWERAEFILQQVNLIGLFYYAASQFFEDFFEGKSIDVELLRRAILNPQEVQPKEES